MSGYKRVNYYELCRLCASNQAKEKTDIFQEEGRKMQLLLKIQSCLPLEICEQDTLPKVVCSQCVQDLEMYYTFRQTCIASETMLSSYFSNFRHTDDFKKAGKVYIKDTTKPLQPLAIEPVTNVTTQPVGPISMQSQPLYTLQLPQMIHCPSPNVKNSNVIGPGNVNKLQDPLGTNCAIQTQQNIQQMLPMNIFPCATSLKASQTNNTHTPTKTINPNVPKQMQPLLNNINTIKSEKTVTPLQQTNILPPAKHMNNQNVVTTLQQQMIDLDAIMDSAVSGGGGGVKVTASSGGGGGGSDICSSKPFKCDDCDKVFKRREHLYQHTKLHTGHRPFSCGHCRKAFMRKEHLLRHLTSHSGAKNFTCDICCKSFSRNDNLNKHRKTHEKQGTFTCEICQKQFIMKHYYLQHKHTHDEIVVPPLLLSSGGLLVK